MIGGAGNDTYYVDSSGELAAEEAGQGIDTGFVGALFYQPKPLSEIEFVATKDANGTLEINLAGNATGQTITGNNGNNVINACGGADTLYGNGGDDTLYGGAGADILNGGSGNDTFAFEPGVANGDTVVDFVGNGSAAGDTPVFVGYGPGATFSQVDATHWQVNYNANASHDVLTFQNGGASAIHVSDIIFV